LEEAAKGIQERLGFGGDVAEPVPLDQVELAPPRLQAPDSLAEIFGDERHERLGHALGKAYRDVVRGFRGEFPNPPDLVAYPRDESEVEAVLSFSEQERAAAIPYGGGTSVTGGVEPRIGDGDGGSVSIDLGGLDSVLEIDGESRAARIQAGANGPHLEDQLRDRGLTLRHFPQSFEF
jgi:alkyldihydroxyacetonephosphate synthase